MVFFHHDSFADLQVSYFFLGAKHAKKVEAPKKSDFIIVVYIVLLFIHDICFIDAIDVLAELVHKSIELFFFFVDLLLEIDAHANCALFGEANNVPDIANVFVKVLRKVAHFFFLGLLAFEDS